jgi:hypothetical protein
VVRGGGQNAMLLSRYDEAIAGGATPDAMALTTHVPAAPWSLPWCAHRATPRVLCAPPTRRSAETPASPLCALRVVRAIAPAGEALDSGSHGAEDTNQNDSVLSSPETVRSRRFQIVFDRYLRGQNVRMPTAPLNPRTVEQGHGQ